MKNTLTKETAKAMIVATLYQDNSDIYTDYFDAKEVKHVFLAWSASERNNMNELKKAALNFEETKNFPGTVDEWTSGHSVLPNYFLGTLDWSGYKVQKLNKWKIEDAVRTGKLTI